MKYVNKEDVNEEEAAMQYILLESVVYLIVIVSTTDHSSIYRLPTSSPFTYSRHTEFILILFHIITEYRLILY